MNLKTNQKDRPEITTDEHLEFLDDLWESGVTNMFGASPYLEREFGLERNDAKQVLTYWIESFEERHEE